MILLFKTLTFLTRLMTSETTMHHVLLYIISYKYDNVGEIKGRLAFQDAAMGCIATNT